MDLNFYISKFSPGIRKWNILLIPVITFCILSPQPVLSQDMEIARLQNTDKDIQAQTKTSKNAAAKPSDNESGPPFHSEKTERTTLKNEWEALFNGENLDGWTPKFTGYELGENYNNTFRVEDGLLTVSYDEWGPFNGEFGHLFYKTPYSHYRIRATYRFIGEQVQDGPGWALRNNGLMLHSQEPETMPADQEFPVSVEVQLLGGNGTDQRSTANLCTPGTNVVMGDSLFTPHCINSDSKTYHGDQWVTVEVEVKGDEIIEHYVNGEPVMQYAKPQYDKQDATAQPLISGEDLLIESGYIAIQAESHPTQFRSIEVRELD
jgi:beta-glucanase (GH16 family)